MSISKSYTMWASLVIVFAFLAILVVCLLIFFGWLVVTTMVHIPESADTVVKRLFLKMIRIMWPFIVFFCVLKMVASPLVYCFRLCTGGQRKLVTWVLFRDHQWVFEVLFLTMSHPAPGLLFLTMSCVNPWLVYTCGPSVTFLNEIESCKVLLFHWIKL